MMNPLLPKVHCIKLYSYNIMQILPKLQYFRLKKHMKPYIKPITSHFSGILYNILKVIPHQSTPDKQMVNSILCYMYQEAVLTFRV